MSELLQLDLSQFRSFFQVTLANRIIPSCLFPNIIKRLNGRIMALTFFVPLFAFPRISSNVVHIIANAY